MIQAWLPTTVLPGLPAVLVAGAVAFGLVASPWESQRIASAEEPRAGSTGEVAEDPIRAMQSAAMEHGKASFGHWGANPEKYSSWTNHSNRMVSVYTFGITLDDWRQSGSPYRDPERLEAIYGHVPDNTLNPAAEYFDQTDLYRLQQQAVEAGKRNIILVVFDGMDWQTSRAAALYQTGKDAYSSGRGTGLSFLDYDKAPTDFGYVVTSPRLGGLKTDVDAQLVLGGDQPATGGFNAKVGGDTPWSHPPAAEYLLGKLRDQPHTVADSASAATSLTSGVKTYNASINYSVDSSQLEPIARGLQRDQGWAIGVVTSVPISHATPGAAYANNVARGDYQDITRDLLGLPSASHRRSPLPGVDVLLGAGWGESKDRDNGQGANYVSGNPYLAAGDLERVAVESGGDYVVVQRTAGEVGADLLQRAAAKAADESRRLFGFFGVKGGHLPYQTADGDYDPTRDVKGDEDYAEADVDENPTLAEMTTAALQVLEKDAEGFWLMVEAGDVDWANHANNIDSSIGAVLSGDAAFRAITDWVEANDAWSETAVILTADHGHYLVIDDPEEIASAAKD